MPRIPIIDSHVHFYDPARIAYPWLETVPAINGRFLPAEYDRAKGSVTVDKIVFVEVDAAPEQALDEAKFARELAGEDARISAIVAGARVDAADVDAQLERLVQIPGVVGVRHLIQYHPEPDWCLAPAFVAGVQKLAAYGLSFDLCLRHHQLASAIALVRLCPNVQFVLDHIAKPGIRDGLWEPWAKEMAGMAALPNVVCKMAGVTTEAGPRPWTEAELQPYVDHAVKSFGFSRLMYGSDWPVVNLASDHVEWLAVLDRLLAGISEEEERQFYRETARRSYRLQP